MNNFSSSHFFSTSLSGRKFAFDLALTYDANGNLLNKLGQLKITNGFGDYVLKSLAYIDRPRLDIWLLALNQVGEVYHAYLSPNKGEMVLIDAIVLKVEYAAGGGVRLKLKAHQGEIKTELFKIMRAAMIEKFAWVSDIQTSTLKLLLTTKDALAQMDEVVLNIQENNAAYGIFILRTQLLALSMTNDLMYKHAYPFQYGGFNYVITARREDRITQSRGKLIASGFTYEIVDDHMPSDYKRMLLDQLLAISYSSQLQNKLWNESLFAMVKGIREANISSLSLEAFQQLVCGDDLQSSNLNINRLVGRIQSTFYKLDIKCSISPGLEINMKGGKCFYYAIALILADYWQEMGDMAANHVQVMLAEDPTAMMVKITFSDISKMLSHIHYTKVINTNLASALANGSLGVYALLGYLHHLEVLKVYGDLQLEGAWFSLLISVPK